MDPIRITATQEDRAILGVLGLTMSDEEIDSLANLSENATKEWFRAHAVTPVVIVDGEQWVALHYIGEQPGGSLCLAVRGDAVMPAVVHQIKVPRKPNKNTP